MPPRWSRPLAELTPRPAPRCRLGLDALEDRVTPAVTATYVGTVLTVTLDDADDAVTITGLDAGGGVFDVTPNVGTPGPFSGVTDIIVNDTGTAAGGQAVTFTDAGGGTIGIAGAITVTGVETVGVESTNVTPLTQAGSLAITGATTAINLVTDVSTSAAGGQSYGGPVVVGTGVAGSTVTLAAGQGNVSFTGTVDAAVAGADALVVNSLGATTFTGSVGGTAALASLTTDVGVGTTIAAGVTTTGGQLYRDAVTVAGGAVTLAAGGDVVFEKPVNAQAANVNSLTVNATGAARFDAAVGGAIPLTALTTGAAGTARFAANVTTSAGQNYNGAVAVTGSAGVTFASTQTGSIRFGGAVDGDATTGAAATPVGVSTGGPTTFVGNVGGTTALAALSTDAAGATAIGDPTAATPAAVTVTTTGDQTFNDAVQVYAPTATFASAGNVTFVSTLGAGLIAGANAVAVNAAGITTFRGQVGGANGVTALASVTTDAAGSTVIGTGVTTAGAQAYNDGVNITPAVGTNGLPVSPAVTLVSSSAGVAFGKTVAGVTTVPFAVRAATTIAFGGNVTFAAGGSQLSAQVGTGGSAAAGVTFAAGVTVRADNQIFRSGDGPGGTTTAAPVALTGTTAPAFRSADGATAPRVFVVRQDAAVTDATLPPLARFGGSAPASYTIISDDGAVTLLTSTLAGPGTANLTVGAAQALTLGTAVNAPAGIVRLRSTSGAVTQTAGGITAAGLGVQAATGIALAAAGNAVAGTLAAQSTAGAIQLALTAPAVVGVVGPDPLAQAFTTTTGITTPDAVAFTTTAGGVLDLTIAAPVSGSSVAANGGAGADAVRVNFTLGGALPNGLAFAGGGGTDTLALTDAGATGAHTYTVNGSVVRDGGTALTPTGVETIAVTGGNGSDTFAVTPDATAAIALVGGQPSLPPATGDALTIDVSGAGNPTLTQTKAADGFGGTAAFSDRQPVTFSQMESVAPQADIRVTATGPGPLAAGQAGTITVIVTNAGTVAATGVRVTDVFPAGVTATYTAAPSAGSSVASASGSGNIDTTATLAAGGTVTFTVTVTPAAGTTGRLTNTATAAPAVNAFDPDPSNNQATTTFTVAAAGAPVVVSPPTVTLTAVGAGAGGGPVVKVFNADGSARFTFFAYDPAYLGGVTVATGDVTGDGVEDIVTGAAQGSSHVKVFDGRTGAELSSFFAFTGFTGGVNVAVAGGKVVAAAGPGGGPIVTGFTVTGGAATQAFSFFAFDPAFRGGAVVGGSSSFLAVGAGPGGGPQVRVFALSDLSQVASFYAFPVGTTDGVSSVAVGTAASGRTTLIAGAGPGGSPTVVTFDALAGTQIGSTLAFDAAFRGGARATTGTAADGTETAVTGAGPGGAPRVRILTPGQPTLDFFAFDPAFTGGVYVG